MLEVINVAALFYSLLVIVSGFLLCNRDLEKTRRFVLCTNWSLSLLLASSCFLNLHCTELLKMSLSLAVSLSLYAIIANLLILLIQQNHGKSFHAENR